MDEWRLSYELKEIQVRKIPKQTGSEGLISYVFVFK